MDIETVKALSEMTGAMRELQGSFKTVLEDLKEVRTDVKSLERELKTGYINRELFNNLEKRVEKQEANSARIAWTIILAVLSAVLGLVLIK